MKLDIDGLKKIIDKYEYGKFDILNRELDIIIDKKNRTVRINPFYMYAETPTSGTCGELADTAIQEIREEYPDYHVYSAIGCDYQYFYLPIDTCHRFLIVSKVKLLNQNIQVGYGKKLDNILSTNPVVIDPSFKTVAQYKQSGYLITSLSNAESFPLQNKELKLHNHVSVPLGINFKEELVYLAAEFTFPNIIGIGIQPPFRTMHKEKITPRCLNKFFLKNSKLLNIVEYIKDHEKIVLDY